MDFDAEWLKIRVVT